MNYYSIAHSLNKKVLGNDPQVKDIAYPCDIRTNPSFIGRFPFQKIEIDPIVANPILYSKSNLTDLIYLWDAGFTYTKLISGKLKSILERNRNHGMQFFQCSIFQNDIEHKDYWLLNMYEKNNDYIDFPNSVVYFKKFNLEVYQSPILFSVGSLNDFIIKFEEKETMDKMHLQNIKFNKDISEDFIFLDKVEGGVKYVVSENLKKEIEDAGCTGIEFQPIELSLNEWLAPGGEREKVYGKSW